MEAKQVSCDQNLPRFIVQNLESDTQIFYTIDNPHINNHCRINELHGRRILGCFHGWVILTSHPDCVLWTLWNPLTSELIRLPPWAHKDKKFHDCCLTSPPDTQGSVLLLLLKTTILFCRVDQRKRKKSNWTEMSYAKQLRKITEKDCSLMHLTCYNGKVYALAKHTYVILVELDIVVKGKQLVITLLPFVDSPIFSPDPRPSCNDNGAYAGYCFLKGTCTDLFYILVHFVDEIIRDVNLYKLDMTSMMWKEVVDFQDAIFFIEFAPDYSVSACYYSSAVGLGLGGYIHIHYGSSNIIHSLHAKNGPLSLSSMSFPIQESQTYAWAMLEWRFEVDHVKSKQKKHDQDTEIVVRPVKGDKTVSDSTTSESHLLNMPLHILELIMEYSIAIEYMKFRATCKHCYLASPLIQWSSKTRLSRLNCYSLVSPWLMELDNHRDTITFIDPMFGDKYFIKTPQEIRRGYRIYCSSYGWLLMYKCGGEQRLVFFNPFTSNIIELPGVHYYLESFCFSAPPTSLDCIVVGFTSYGPCHVYIHFVSQGSRWHAYDVNFGGDPYSYQFPTFSGRDIYALCNNGKIEAFRDITVDDYSWEFVADKGPSSRCKSPTQYFLSNCDQHLLLVIIGELGESVEVFKLNQSTEEEEEEWEKIDGLGKHMIFISKTSCICLEAASPEMGNKIYFPRLLHDKDTEIVFYSLETCRYHTFNDKIIQESFGADFFGTDHFCDPHTHTWIEPSWS